MSTFNFKVSGTAVNGYTAVGNFTSDSIEMVGSHDWSVSISESGTDGTPTYTIQCSNDNSKWYDYTGASAIALADSFEDHYFSYRYIRLSWTATGVTVGTISAYITVNNDI